ncbi:MAG: hypothetical protein JST39_12220, partial [Bacteroidetes bacterium]|nr:hypothetical protein [Bacteroidota bacterium]
TMNRFVPLCLLSVLMLSAGSCKKSDDGNKIITDPPMDALTGSWKLVVSQAGLTPVHVYTSADSAYTVQFSGSAYSFKTNNVITRSGSYSLMRDSTFTSNVCLAQPAVSPYLGRIVFDSIYTTNKTFLRLVNDSLFMASGCFAIDGGRIAIYRHIQ